jgi:hypothetical protein
MRGQKAIYGAVAGLRSALNDADVPRTKKFVAETFFLVEEMHIKPDMEVNFPRIFLEISRKFLI